MVILQYYAVAYLLYIGIIESYFIDDKEYV